MPSTLESLRQYVENTFPESIVASCREESCSLNLEGIPHRIIIKGEKACNSKICDCIVFVETDESIRLCTVELKSKRLHPRDIPEKLSNCARIAFDVFEKCDIETPTPLFLVLHKDTKSSEHQVLSRKRVHFNGRNYHIGVMRCGSSLSKLLKGLE